MPETMQTKRSAFSPSYGHPFIFCHLYWLIYNNHRVVNSQSAHWEVSMFCSPPAREARYRLGFHNAWWENVIAAGSSPLLAVLRSDLVNRRAAEIQRLLTDRAFLQSSRCNSAGRYREQEGWGSCPVYRWWHRKFNSPKRVSSLIFHLMWIILISWKLALYKHFKPVFLDTHTYMSMLIFFWND